jgi:hypothetical protein
MSNVLKRFQGISEMEFYHTADDLRTELSSLLYRDKVVPKKYRYNVTYAAVDAVNRMMRLMHRANRKSLYDPEEVKERRDLQQECIECLDEICEIIQYAIRNVWWQKLHAVNKETGEPTQERLLLEKHLTDIGDLIDREDRLLKGWKRSTRLLKNK